MLIWQIANALLWLHQHGIAHLDVKPENIVICKLGSKNNGKTEWSFKLNDFGLVLPINSFDVGQSC